MSIGTQLEEAFVQDHRAMRRGLSAIIVDLERDDLETALREADELDRTAGGHIRFEEEVLCGEVARLRGHEYASGLYREHETVRHGIASLLAHASGKHLDQQLKQRILGDLRVGLNHAVSCGTLISHLTALDPDRQRVMLDRLRELRKSGVRWSELPRNADG